MIIQKNDLRNLQEYKEQQDVYFSLVTYNGNFKGILCWSNFYTFILTLVRFIYISHSGYSYYDQFRDWDVHTLTKIFCQFQNHPT